MNAAELRQALVLANAFKEGDLAVGGADDDRLRSDARDALLHLPLSEFSRVPIVEDGVTEALSRTLDRRRARGIDSLTIAQIRDRLLEPSGAAWAASHREALPSEAIAALAKVMSNRELSALAMTLFNPHPGNGVPVGSRRHVGSRIQPNSPGDDDDEILFSIFEGLCHGCGDVVIGLNPASDDVETIIHLEALLASVVERLHLPTRYCVLSDLVKQRRAQARTRVDVGFQSLAGTSRALTGMIGLDIDGILELTRAFGGLYFETGQGAEVTNGTANGVDMVTLESRTYGVARAIVQQTSAWTIVNDVAGFIGPEVFKTSDQLERACLEDIVMAKLHGLTMGLDVCATFHMGIPPAALRELTGRLASSAAPAYLMAVAGNADPMLGYLTTSFREHPRLRDSTGRRMTTAMEERLRALGVTGVERPDAAVDGPAHLYSVYARAGGDVRAGPTLMEQGRRKVRDLRARGFDVGYGYDADGLAAADARVEKIYEHARRALYAGLDPGVLSDASPRYVDVRTRADNRDDYLAHPRHGEELRAADARLVAAVYEGAPPVVQFVISDGLNANAFNEHGRALLPPLRRSLVETGCHIGRHDIVIRNGRVRAGYHTGGLVGATLVVHVIGERPGTGLNTLSAYLTYGLDESGRPRWRTDLDHACTTAICGIHPRGLSVENAVDEIVRTIGRILARRRSGVSLNFER
jgi:ethanolamine ammonia-lyase large subunit